MRTFSGLNRSSGRQCLQKHRWKGGKTTSQPIVKSWDFRYEIVALATLLTLDTFKHRQQFKLLLLPSLLTDIGCLHLQGVRDNERSTCKVCGEKKLWNDGGEESSPGERGAIDRSLVCTSACVEENDGRVDDADEGRVADAIKVAMSDDGRSVISPITPHPLVKQKYRGPGKGLYVVGRNFFLLLLNFSALPCLGPA